MAMPIFCIISVRSLKYFNTVLAFAVLTLVVKIVQIVALSLFGHAGACNLTALYRVPVIVYLIL